MPQFEIILLTSMGINNSNTNEGGFIINLDKPYYYPGEMVHGKIYSNFNKNFETSRVELEIKGEEYTSFFEKKKSKKNTKESYMKKRVGVTLLYSNTQELFKPSNNQLSHGHFIYPFTFMLPLNLRGSFEYYDKDYTAYIKYILEVRALAMDSHKIKNTILLIVRQPPQIFQYPCKMSDTKDIKICCCIGKGKNTVSVRFEKNYYCIEDKVNVICEFDSTKCKVGVNCITLTLFQKITIKDKKDREKTIIRRLCYNPFKSLNVSFIYIKESRTGKHKNNRGTFKR